MSNESKNITQETIREMARLSILSNRISDVQEKNLKLYPFIFFDGIKNISIDYDFSTNVNVDTEKDNKKAEILYKIKNVDTSKFRISYHIELDQTTYDNLDKRFNALEQAVRSLFWNNVRVEVFFNNKEVYKSK